MKKLTNVFFISSEWKFYHRKEFTKAVINEFEEEFDNLIVQAPVSLSINLFVKFKSRFIAFISGKLKPKVVDQKYNLVTPYILFHQKLWLRFPLLAKIDSFLLKNQILNFAKKLNCSNRFVLWLSVPHQYFLAKSFSKSKIVYDTYDDNELDYNGNVLEQETLYNKKLIEHSELTICLARYTYDRFVKYSDKVIYLPNSNNFELFESHKKYSTPTEMMNIVKPVIGYLGTIRNWIDFNLIKKMLNALPEYQIVFIGYVDRNSFSVMPELKLFKNFTHINFVEYQHIPDYIKRFSVGIIPFRVNNFTSSVFPNKFFEYMAAGIPIVTTALPELDEYKDYAGYSKTDEEFIENCKRAIAGEFSQKINFYKEIAKNNDWKIRMHLLKPFMDKTLSELA